MHPRAAGTDRTGLSVRPHASLIIRLPMAQWPWAAILQEEATDHAGGIYIAFIVIGANGIVRGEKVTSLARWPPTSRLPVIRAVAGPSPWGTIGPALEDYWLLAPFSTSGGVFPLGRLTTDA